MADGHRPPRRRPLPPADAPSAKLVRPVDPERSESIPPPHQKKRARTGAARIVRPQHPGAANQERDNRLTVLVLVAALVMVVLAAIAYIVVLLGPGLSAGSRTTGSVTADESSPDQSPAGGESNSGESNSGESTGGESAENPQSANEPTASSGAFVEARLSDGEVVVVGRVPDQTLADRLQLASEIAYSPSVRWDLTIDATAGGADWLAASPQVVVLLQALVEGQIQLADGKVVVTGSAPSRAAVERLQRAAVEASGLPVEVDQVEITGLKDPILVVAAEGERVAISGVLPTEEIRRDLVAAAVDLYGVNDVVDATTVDPGVYPVLWMGNGGRLISALSAFASYEVRLDGRLFSASLSGTAVFDTGSVAISPEFGQILNYGVGVLTRDPFISALVEGHTDDRGDPAYNLQLSQERADAVAGYVTQRGIDESRIEAVGRGEAEPIDNSETDEGRAKNRRVEITLEVAP